MLREVTFAANDAARLDAGAAPCLSTGIKVPGPHDVRAAWLALPVETRDRIGTLAVGHMFQMFLSGDDTAPERQPLRGDDAAETVAARLGNEAFEELWWTIEAALPELFGTPGVAPSWSRPAR